MKCLKNLGEAALCWSVHEMSQMEVNCLFTPIEDHVLWRPVQIQRELVKLHTDNIPSSVLNPKLKELFTIFYTTVAYKNKDVMFPEPELFLSSDLQCV